MVLITRATAYLKTSGSSSPTATNAEKKQPQSTISFEELLRVINSGMAQLKQYYVKPSDDASTPNWYHDNQNQEQSNCKTCHQHIELKIIPFSSNIMIVLHITDKDQDNSIDTIGITQYVKGFPEGIRLGHYNAESNEFTFQICDYNTRTKSTTARSETVPPAQIERFKAMVKTRINHELSLDKLTE